MLRVAVLTLSIGFAACQAEDPPIAQFDSGVADPSAITVERRDDCPQVDPAAYVSRVDPVATTSAQTQAIRGIAVGASDVLVRNADGVIQNVGAASAGDGRFCVEAHLVANTQNQLELIPRLPDGCWGQPRTVLVTHQFTTSGTTSTTGAMPLPEPQNIALGKAAYSPHFSSGGGGSGSIAVTDGYTDSYAVLSIWDPLASEAVWVRIDLGSTQRVSEFKIDWDPATTKHWATHYAIYTSVAASPGDPTERGSRDWTIAVDVPDAGWGSQNHRVNGISARWVALVMHADDAFIKDTFHLAEFSVFTATNQDIPIGGGNIDTCP
jgi:hypothetical protein